MSNSNFVLYLAKRNALKLPADQQSAGNAKNTIFTPFFKDDALPVLPVPRKLWFVWENSAITFPLDPKSFPGVLPIVRDPI